MYVSAITPIVCLDCMCSVHESMRLYFQLSMHLCLSVAACLYCMIALLKEYKDFIKFRSLITSKYRIHYHINGTFDSGFNLAAWKIFH